MEKPESVRSLIIHKSSNTLPVIQKALKELNCIFQDVQHNMNTIDFIHNFKPNLIILSPEIGTMSSIMLIKQIRAITEFQKISIVMISGSTQEEVMVISLSNGVDEYIVSPFHYEELLNRIKRLLKIKRDEMRLSLKHDRLVKMRNKLEKEKNMLKKYFSDDIVQNVLNGNIKNSLSGEYQTATILAFDIRESTRIAEAVAPDQFAQFLNEIFSDIIDLIYSNDGSINKMLGDGLIASFGSPVSTGQDALNAVTVALKIQEYIEMFNEFKPDYLTEPIEAGIGISTGTVFAGNVGNDKHMEFTVAGKPVEFGGRLESLNKISHTKILIDETTRNILSNKIRVRQVIFKKIRDPEIADARIFTLDQLVDSSI